MAPNPEPRGSRCRSSRRRGAQRDCDYVVYDLRFGARGDPAKFVDPAFIAELEALSDDLHATSFRPVLKIVGDRGFRRRHGCRRRAAARRYHQHHRQPQRHGDDSRLPALGDRSRRARGAQRALSSTSRSPPRSTTRRFPRRPWSTTRPSWTSRFAGAAPIEIPSHDPALPDDGNFLTGDPTSDPDRRHRLRPAADRLPGDEKPASRSTPVPSTACRAAAPSSTT